MSERSTPPAPDQAEQRPVREGATVYLPVFHEGGYFYFGDGHALQRDGEIVGLVGGTEAGKSTICLVASGLAPLSIGVYPILMGITMWLQQKLNPAPTDPTQAMIFAWMPWVFMFMLGTFASGLVIYWVANNTITFIQQYFIMRSQGVRADIFGNIKSGFKRKKAQEK